MPVCHIDGPEGLPLDARRLLVQRATNALRETYRIPDIHIFFREYPADRYAHDGELGKRPTPIVTLSVPELHRLDGRRHVVRALSDAITEAYGRLADTDNTLVLIHEYPLDRVGWQKSLQSDKAEIIELVQQLNS
jgi:phenylpyruvate tautomerase PptA (4-oxalocrotonate tautomerase family)